VRLLCSASSAIGVAGVADADTLYIQCSVTYVHCTYSVMLHVYIVHTV
jgi:hypothetical protein